MKKRHCERFSIPGTTLYYKNRPGIFIKPVYPEKYFPVLNLSRGGVSFLCNERIKPGKKILVKIEIPGVDQPVELFATIRWISRNREQS
ncbi:MAG: PilZ domain-containing protein [Thermodesulfobacteriota bacterium]|nr:PilZ domain-containing protein [Thermodesulfobacteriota bacterium]